MDNYIRIKPPYRLKGYIFLQNYMTSIGLITFMFSFVFSVGGFANLDLSSIALRFSETEQITGKITGITNTGFEIGDKNIIAYDYEINHPSIGLYQGFSFDRFADLSVGDKVSVEYIVNNPIVNRIVGMRNSFVNEATIVLWVFWLIGLILIFLGVKNTKNFLRLLKEGYITTASLSKKPSSKVIDETRFLVLEFSFTTKNGESIIIKKELSNAKNILDDKNEFIIYSEKNPNKNFFVDRLPRKLKEYIYEEIKRTTIE